jgi:translocation and assembly module TamB
MQAIQLTQTLRRFSGQGGAGFDPLGTLREATGLDNIAVDTDDSGAPNVGVGKYLSDKVYLEFKRGQSEASGAANLQIEITPQINVETEVGQDARAGGGIFWRRDY